MSRIILVIVSVLAMVGVVVVAPAVSHAQGEAKLYQCPMHPEVTSTLSGQRCPICNMALVEVTPPSSPSPPPSPPPPSSSPPRSSPPRSSPAATTAAPAAVVDFTCPMHTTITATAAGRCTICGMPLVPRAELAAHAGHHHEHATFVCPMHPDVITDAPGRCPQCGMDLVDKDLSPPPPRPTRAITHFVDPRDPARTSETAGPGLVPVYADESGVVRIDPVVVQNMGLRIAPVTREPIFRHIRALGTVDVAEDEIAVVNLRYSGWVEQLYVDDTGAEVRAGQALAEVYSPELASAQEELLLAVRSQGVDSPLAMAARRRLSFFGMGDRDIDRIVADKAALRTVTVRAPRSGFILHKNVVAGARVMAGTDLFRIGNLKKIWINAEVYESDAPWVHEGSPATMELSFQQGRVSSGKVAYVYPTLNMKSRTLTVRLEFENPGLGLKPGMFATVRIEARRKEGALAVPTEAVLHSGERQLVFVALGLGRYDKRDITTGLVADRNLTEVLDGLVEGERVVVSGQFLLDSESQMHEAVQKLLDARLHSKSGEMPSSPSSSPASSSPASSSPASSRAPSTYWTCSMHPQVVEDGPGQCPICGMNLVEKAR